MFGPSSVRDGAGYAVDLRTDPLRLIHDDNWLTGLALLRVVNTREQLLARVRP